MEPELLTLQIGIFERGLEPTYIHEKRLLTSRYRRPNEYEVVLKSFEPEPLIVQIGILGRECSFRSEQILKKEYNFPVERLPHIGSWKWY